MLRWSAYWLNYMRLPLSLSEDVTQQATFNVWRAKKQYPLNDPLKRDKIISAVVRNAAFDEGRDPNNHCSYELNESRLRATIELPSHENARIAAIDWAKLEHALPPMGRTILKLRLEGFEFLEIAEMLELPSQHAARVSFARALAKALKATGQNRAS